VSVEVIHPVKHPDCYRARCRMELMFAWLQIVTTKQGLRKTAWDQRKRIYLLELRLLPRRWPDRS
jgi:hypothetical protein